jgi:ubiquinone biosynthesis protein
LTDPIAEFKDDLVSWLLALVTYLVGAWVVTGLAGRLLGAPIPLARALIAGLAGLLIGLGGAALMQASNPGRRLYAVDFMVISLLTTLVLVAFGGLVVRSDRRRRARPTPMRPRPLHAVLRWERRVHRYAQILLIAARYAWSARSRRRQPRLGDAGTAGLDLTSALEKAGGMFVKLGQVLSTRPDLVPPQLLARLATLQDSAAPEPAGQVVALITAELGETPERLFTTFDPAPVAAASLAQVHRCQLPSGAQVAVKALRPGVEDLVERDLEIMRRLARTAHEHTRWARRLGVGDLVQGFSDNLVQELDLRIEARNTRTVADQLGAGSAVRIPAVYPELSTRRIMVSEFIDGTSLQRAGPLLDRLNINRRDLARSLLRCLLRQILGGGTFHADPHPGNVLVLSDGTLALLDFGSVGRLDPLQQDALQDILVALARRDPRALADGLSHITTIRDVTDQELLERALARFLVTRLGPGMPLSIGLLDTLFRLLLEFGLVVDAELAGVFRAMITLDGTLRLLDRDFNLLEEAEHAAVNVLTRRVLPDAPTAIRDQLLGALPLLRRAPRQLDRIATSLQHGTLSIHARPFADRRDVHVLANLTNRITLAVLGAGTAIASALLLTTPGGPRITGGLGAYELLGTIGLAAAIILGMRVLVATSQDPDDERT